MTFGTILADCYRRLDFPTSPDSSTVTRLKAFVNDAYQEVLGEPGMAEWIAANTTQVTFASVASQAQYAIPTAIERVDGLVERTTRRRLRAQSWDWYRATLPDQTVITATPTDYIPIGFQAVAVQPSAATGLWAVSTASGDTAVTITVETVRSGGIVANKTVTLTGTTRVQIGTFTDHVEVTKVYLSAAASGDVSLYDASSNGTLLGTLPAGTTYGRYFAFALWPTPAAAITYYLDGPYAVRDLVDDSDEPPFPARFHRILVEGAVRREYEKRDDDTRAQRAEQRRRAVLSDLRYFLTCSPDFLPVANRAARANPSRLGAWFPSWRG